MKTRMFQMIIMLVVAGALGVFGGAVYTLVHELPEVQLLEGFEPTASTRVLSRDGQLVAEFFIEKRTPIPLKDIPRYLKEAVVAVEDQNFYHHFGVDLRGVARAVYHNLLKGRFVEGGSTITQQLAKVLFLSPEKSLARKLREAVLALQIERRYTKDRILEIYLNQVYMGSGAYGVEAASRIYFGKSVRELDLAQCAMLAGLPRLPGRYSPIVNREAALRRRRWVLQRMVKEGYITPQQAYLSNLEPLLEGGSRRGSPSGGAPYFVEYLRQQMENQLGTRALYREGLTIHSTLDTRLQQAAQEALREGLDQLIDRHPDKYNDPTAASALQAALIALDVHTGGILAMVGGREFSESQFNRAVQAHRQPGSAFKPVVYAAAVQAGLSQADIIWDSPVIFPSPDGGEPWEPHNFSDQFEGEISLRLALEKSQNVATVRLGQKIGIAPVVDLAHRMGIHSSLPPYLSLVLGSADVTLVELTSVYATLANGGVWQEPFAVREIQDRKGETIFRARPKAREALSAEDAHIVIDMLKGVIESGTGRKARVLGRPLAGKTGTTNDFRDAWFIGFSPRVVAGVWVGNDDHSPLGNRETGARAALPIWISFMEKALSGTPVEDFVPPPDLVEIDIDKRSGLLSAPGCGEPASMLLRQDQVPARKCGEKESPSLVGR
ncbi:MAG: PBP1A family penicillin-binding protein [Deltaproteobacteria bacterium]|nr:PBP1A family penicillin-binding protein [Deltaproteobacteria bacterium]MBW2305482.1 PBP1A family penicillin-binding protein [Deltaproteobacteria bacterium]